jgi:hypothetical protein
MSRYAGKPYPLALVAGAPMQVAKWCADAGREVERGGEMVGQTRHGYCRNRSAPGAAGFLILSQALLGPDR